MFAYRIAMFGWLVVTACVLIAVWSLAEKLLSQ
jgi:hypothetical protein